MRHIRCVAVVAATLSLTALSSAEAQGPRPFRDSWFWGVYGGGASYTSANTADPTLTGSSSVAPQVGMDWLITRTSGGLYLSVAQSFLTSQGAIENGPTSADVGFRPVDVKDLRRVNVAAMMFPGDYVRLRPYVGLGVAFDYLGAAEPVIGPTDGNRQQEFARSRAAEVKAALGPLLMLGAQYRVLSSTSVFGQFTASAMSKDFLLSNGRPISFGLQLGLRYNIGTSIDRDF